ncbi:MAG: HPF/RaiA family ribosome-associated protein [Thalassotalea sp.]|nr:HPF/RaiA family ribosome-associated protein [Thalassotalea sp.]MDG2394673.1 HPF/RaiA family ribosome-associated protein [Thalassotalea sp.]
MKIIVQNGLNESDGSIEDYIQRMIRLALSKAAANISSITFCLSDVMGKNGKYEKHCLLTISLHNLANIVIEEAQPDLYVAIDRVIQKATRKLSRKLSS